MQDTGQKLNKPRRPNMPVSIFDLVMLWLANRIFRQLVYEQSDLFVIHEVETAVSAAFVRIHYPDPICGYREGMM